jgi:hypothetical protein
VYEHPVKTGAGATCRWGARSVHRHLKRQALLAKDIMIDCQQISCDDPRHSANSFIFDPTVPFLCSGLSRHLTTSAHRLQHWLARSAVSACRACPTLSQLGNPHQAHITDRRCCRSHETLATMVKVDPKRNYYADLELTSAATTEDIKKQFRNLGLFTPCSHTCLCTCAGLWLAFC